MQGGPGEIQGRWVLPEIPDPGAAQDPGVMQDRRGFREYRGSAVMWARKGIRDVKGRKETWVLRDRQVRWVLQVL